MNLEHLFCPNIDCPASGQTGEARRFQSHLFTACSREIPFAFCSAPSSAIGNRGYESDFGKALTGEGNLVIHSQQEKRCSCTVCGKAFASTKGTLFYRLHSDPKIVMCVIVLLAYGCLVQAIVKAFGLDGAHGQAVVAANRWALPSHAWTPRPRHRASVGCMGC